MDDPIGGSSPSRLFFSNAVPTMLGLLLTSGVVVVDGLFVGRIVGGAALAAVNLTVPVLYGLMAVAIMIGAGGSAAAAPLVGAGRPREAARLRSVCLAVLAAVTVALSALVFALREPILLLLGAQGEVASNARSYLSIMCLAWPFMMLSIGLSIFLRGAGESSAALRNGLAANALNLALDWLFMVPLGMGVAGAALASAIASALNCGLGFLAARRRGERTALARPEFRRGELGPILANGSSELVGQLSVMITSWAVNRAALSLFGTPGLAAVTVNGYLSFVESMIVSGLAFGLAPVVGLGWGAGKAALVREARRIAIAASVGIGALFLGLALACGRLLASVWTGGDAAATAIAAAGFGLYALSFLANGYNLVATSFLTSLQDAAGSAIVACLRGLVLPLALVFLLPALFGATGFWAAAPAAEALTLAAAVPLSRRGLRRLEAGFPGARAAGS